MKTIITIYTSLLCSIFLLGTTKSFAQKLNCTATVTGQPVTVSLTSQPASQNKCLGSSVTFSVAATGTSPITYQWKKDGTNISGATSNSYTKSNLTLADEGNYTCVASNLCRNIESQGATLKVIDLSINAGSDVKICKNSSIGLLATGSSNHATESGTLNYSWSPSSGLSASNVNNPTANPSSTTNYTVTVSDQLGCSKTDAVEVWVQEPFANEQICLVSVDPSVGKNKLMWQKTQGVGTEYFLVYKETGTNSYSQIGNVVSSSAGEYIDYFSTPEAHGDKYKISVLDTCGNESGMSFYHKTINLTISSFGTTMGLIWDDYVDESGGYSPFRYYIYRGTQPSNLVLLDSVSGSFNSYNDVNVTSVYYYMIGVKKPGGCNTAKSTEFLAFSNKKDNSSLIGIEKTTMDNNFSIFPNPVKDELTIELNSAIKKNFEIVNIIGQTIYSSVFDKKVIINTNSFPAGIYLIKINCLSALIKYFTIELLIFQGFMKVYQIIIQNVHESLLVSTLFKTFT